MASGRKGQSGGGIVRVRKRSSPYATIDKRFLSDPRLSWKAKGLLTYLLSKPDDWKVIISDLVRQSTCKEAAVRSGLKELGRFGYLLRVRVADRRSGRFKTWEMTVFETPELAAEAGLREPTLFEKFEPVRERPVKARSEKQPEKQAQIAPYEPPEPRFSQTPPDRGFPHVDEPHVGEPDVGEPHVDEPDVGNRGLLRNERTKNDLPMNDGRGEHPPPLEEVGFGSFAVSEEEPDPVMLLVRNDFAPDDARRLIDRFGEAQARTAVRNADVLHARGKLKHRRRYIAAAISGRYGPIEAGREAECGEAEVSGESAASRSARDIAAAKSRRAEETAAREQLDAERREMVETLARLTDQQWGEHVRRVELSLPGKARRDLAAGVHPREQHLVRHLVFTELRKAGA